MVGVSTEVPSSARLVRWPRAPNQGRTAGLCPPVCRQGWKWSETATPIEPERLGADREVEELLRAELLGGGLVAEC